jgi:hypothetical protein
MAKSAQARIQECEDKIEMYTARLEKADSSAKKASCQKAINSWQEKLEEARVGQLKSLEKSERASSISTLEAVGTLWEEGGDDEKETKEAKGVTFSDDYTNIISSASVTSDDADRHRDLLKKIRVAEITCGLIHDISLENQSIEELEAHLKSILQQAARQSRSVTNMAVNMYVGLLLNGPTIINHYSADLGFYVDRDVLNGSLRSQETMDNIRDAFNEIFEDSPEMKQVMNTMFRGVPKLVAVTAMAFAPTIRLGQKKD